jgi:anti-anti-sigma regulatory factor
MEQPMLETAQGWHVSVERGPDWLFLRLHASPDSLGDYSHLAEQIWQVLQQHFTYRVVLEFSGFSSLPSSLIGQLVMLHKRLHVQGGLLRLCGLTTAQQQSFAASRLDSRFPIYHNREAAVWGHRPSQPR